MTPPTGEDQIYKSEPKTDAFPERTTASLATSEIIPESRIAEGV